MNPYEKKIIRFFPHYLIPFSIRPEENSFVDNSEISFTERKLCAQFQLGIVNQLEMKEKRLKEMTWNKWIN